MTSPHLQSVQPPPHLIMNPPFQHTRVFQASLSVLKALRAEGHEAFFAGGAVRDMLLGVVAKDFDIATSAPPDIVVSLFEKTVEVGAQFGVIRVLLDGHEVEVATFRTEGRASPSPSTPSRIIATTRSRS